jgi:hypothetical protein
MVVHMVLEPKLDVDKRLVIVYATRRRKKLVHYDHLLQLVHCNSCQENVKIYHFGCQLKVWGFQSSNEPQQ